MKGIIEPCTVASMRNVTDHTQHTAHSKQDHGPQTTDHRPQTTVQITDDEHLPIINMPNVTKSISCTWLPSSSGATPGPGSDGAIVGGKEGGGYGSECNCEYECECECDCQDERSSGCRRVAVCTMSWPGRY